MATETPASQANGERLRVLIVRTGAMGDVLHALPAVAALRLARPDWFIGWAIEPRWSGLLQSSASFDAAGSRGPGMPVVDRCYRAETAAWKRAAGSLKTLSNINGLRRQLRGEQFDLCVDMQGTIRSAVIGRMAGARRFVGRAEPREAPARWLYKERVETWAAHVVAQGCELLGAAVGEVLQPPPVTLPIDDASEGWCGRLLANAAGKFVLLSPTAGWGAKVWPAERYGALAAELRRAGYRVLVNAASSGDSTALQVVEASAGAAEMATCTVEELIALTRRAALMIAGDTGPLHLAAALRRPVVALFGPTDPARNGPYGTRATVLRSEGSRTSHARLKETEAGLLQIGVEEVVDAAFEMLREMEEL